MLRCSFACTDWIAEPFHRIGALRTPPGPEGPGGLSREITNLPKKKAQNISNTHYARSWSRCRLVGVGVWLRGRERGPRPPVGRPCPLFKLEIISIKQNYAPSPRGGFAFPDIPPPIYIPTDRTNRQSVSAAVVGVRYSVTAVSSVALLICKARKLMFFLAARYGSAGQPNLAGVKCVYVVVVVSACECPLEMVMSGGGSGPSRPCFTRLNWGFKCLGRLRSTKHQVWTAVVAGWRKRAD